MLPKISTAFVLGLAVFAMAQQPQQGTPPVKVNILNVCAPSADEQKEIASALGKIPKQPQFAADFEVARGMSTVPAGEGGESASSSQPISANWVRIRRDFLPQAMFTTVQYSFSQDRSSMVETLVLHVREPKDVVQVSVEDKASAVTSPAAMLASNTPVDRIRLERFGKSSVVLARCTSAENGPPPNQSAYEPLFREASQVIDRYRSLLGARRLVPGELARLTLNSARAPESPKKTTPLKK
ncbi:MAG TPA: hypothetical protein VFI95_23525 [Terriglobales bacterium]|nr:hypothetical protein [Terriglobales bacterium]